MTVLFAPPPISFYHRPPTSISVRPPTHEPPSCNYPSPPYNESMIRWPGSSQGPYAPQSSSRSSYPNPANPVLAPSLYSYATPASSPYGQQLFNSDPRSSATPRSATYYPMNTLPDPSQGPHPSCYPTNEQPSGIVYADPNGLNNK